MSIKKFRQLRVIITFFVGIIVSISVINNRYPLAVAGVLTGMLFMIIVRSKTKIAIDEREKTIREKAAQITYAVFTPTIGIGAFLLLIPYRKLSPVFAKGEFSYLESLGTVLAYLALFLIAIYAVSYFYLNRKYGGSRGEE